MTLKKREIVSNKSKAVCQQRMTIGVKEVFTVRVIHPFINQACGIVHYVPGVGMIVFNAIARIAEQIAIGIDQNFAVKNENKNNRKNHKDDQRPF